jgi:hypothetical protein
MTASTLILDALNQSYGSASSKAGLAAIAEGEGGSTFTILYGGSQWAGSLATFPSWAGKGVGNSETHAAGAFQFEPGSYGEAARISGRSSFYPQDQIQNAWDYAATIFAARYSAASLHDVLQAGGNGLALIPTFLLSIWPGGCNSNFPSRYAANLPLVSTTVPLPASLTLSGSSPPQPIPALLHARDMKLHVSKVSLQIGRGRKFRSGS